MLTAIQEKFAQKYKISPRESRLLASLAERCFTLGERIRNNNYAAGKASLDETDAELFELARNLGFDNVAYPGLRPCLAKDGLTLEIP